MTTTSAPYDFNNADRYYGGVTGIAPAANANQIVSYFDALLDPAFVPPASIFSIHNSGGADSVTSVAVAGSTLILTKSRASLATDNIRISYRIPATNFLRFANGNRVAPYTRAVQVLAA